MTQSPGTARKIAYDFGMNNGDDVAYYLLKGHDVVAVEANPTLCQHSRARFAREIDEGRLTIINAVVTDAEYQDEVDFYIHRTNDVLSQFPAPAPEVREQFDRIRLASIPATVIVRNHGEPHYIKIDLEGFDPNVLRSLFGAGIKPPFISAESHSVEVFSLLCAHGYRSFNLVDGLSVPKVYANAEIAGEAGPVRHAFPWHSTGPYGEDLRSPWHDAESFFYLLARRRLGWKDVHASLEPMPGTVSVRKNGFAATGTLMGYPRSDA
ncbi:FkbM family methyltransferase [Methylobacterium sp. J-076]|uniref:FkbM family methyltransferase n=1 Tax=Methylobacterium sp. J-076 TaxID=2836655 RepID=UPI001FBA354C|nr:FkbM family methyltransferase [Methylobacterium sp. J-076]MCJ2014801.1 FkbM family methyltransferase [Methylobacterium sp. J-076]